jgi:glutamyl-tRNA synthetase
LNGVVTSGRFAPSPTGDLHLGNLRTALVAWLAARSSGRRFLIRMEDLDRERVVPGAAERQLADLRELGLDWDGEVVRQSERHELYDAAIASLTRVGLTYPCFCTRREIREASSAPQGSPMSAYPGTCRELTYAQRRARATTRPPALRLAAGTQESQVDDALHGSYVGAVEDVVLRRNDGQVAYNLAVVVDDADQSVDQVVRGEDLLPATPAQAHLADLLGLPRPGYLHVPLALNPAGQRLAKRDGAVTLAALAAQGQSPRSVLGRLAVSLDLACADEPVLPSDLLERFTVPALPRTPWIVA